VKIVHYAFVLGMICLVCTLGVAGTFTLTRERIERMKRADRLRAQAAVMGDAGGANLRFKALNPKAAEADQVMEVRDAGGFTLNGIHPEGKVLGYAALGEAHGYGGRLQVMVGMDADAKKITGISIISQSETPGLGTRVAEIKSKKTWFSILNGRARREQEETLPEFLKQFLGRKPGELALKSRQTEGGQARQTEGGQAGSGPGIQAVTGATVSSRAVVNAAKNAVAKIPKAALLAEQPADAVSGATTSGSPASAAPAKAPESK